MEEVIKKSKLHAKNRFDLEKLIYPMEHFLACTYHEELEEVCFQYDTSRVKEVKEIKKETVEHQLQFLVNLASLQALIEAYDIPFDTGNLYYDENFIPYVRKRDIYLPGQKMTKENFLFLYKTYIGGILFNQVTVHELQESGIEVLKEQEGFKEFAEVTDIESLAELLRNKKTRYLDRQKVEMTLVTKKSNMVKTILSIASSVLLLTTVGVLGYYLLEKRPAMERVMNGSQAYIKNDYVGCIDALREVELEDMLMTLVTA